MGEKITAELLGREAEIEIGRPSFGEVAAAVDLGGGAGDIALVRLLVVAIDGVPLESCEFTEAMAALEPITTFLSAGAKTPAPPAT